MEFPKQLMSLSELEQLGFSKKLLREIAIKEGYPLAIREKPTKTAQIKIDTQELTRYLKRVGVMMERR